MHTAGGGGCQGGIAAGPWYEAFDGGYKAVIAHDRNVPGEFVGLNGGADFYAALSDMWRIVLQALNKHAA